MQLIIGNRNYSSWSLRPWLLLSHFELPFDCHRIVLDSASFTTEIRRFSKAGKVPVLIDRGTEIWDSLAICEYVSEQYLDGRGWPSDPLARAQFSLRYLHRHDDVAMAGYHGAAIHHLPPAGLD